MYFPSPAGLLRDRVASRFAFALSLFLLGLLTPRSHGQNILINYGDTWRYSIPTSDPGTSWRTIAFNDSGWGAGAGLLGFETATLPVTIKTTVGASNSANITYLFRKSFIFNGDPTGATMAMDQIVDDGVAYYLNGNLLGSTRYTTSGAWNSAATATVSNATEELNALKGSATGLVHGNNVLTAEVHQAGPQNSDLVFGARFTVTSMPLTSTNWHAIQFGTTSNSGNAADLANPDNDGMSNLMEYALGTDPNRHTPSWGTVAVQGSNLTLTYSRRKAALNEVTFNCQWSTSPTGALSSTGVTEQILSDDGLTQLVRVQVPLNGNAKLFFKIQVNRLALPSAPVAPSNLQATAASSSQINLTWSDVSTNEIGFKIERKTGSGGAYAAIATVSPGVTTYSNTALAADTSYSYRVRAVNAGGAGLSGEANARTLASAASLPAAPTNLVGVATSTTDVTLTWTDASTNETGFRIERRINGGTFSPLVTLGAGSTTYHDGGTTARDTCIYRIQAFNNAGNSAFSAEAQVTMPAPPANSNIPYLNVAAAVVYTKGQPGFMDIEIYQSNGRYYVRDKVTAANYTDSRPRRYYYVDMENVGPSLEQGFALPERGGIYQIICKRWENADPWQRPNQEAAMQWVIKPGPLGVAGETYIPTSFTFDTNDWRDQQHLRIPAFQPIAGKVSPSYRYNEDQTWNDILSHGASQTAMGVGPGGNQSEQMTDGNPFNEMGEQGFMNLTENQVRSYASQVNPYAIYFTDYEKQPGWYGTQTYWSIDLPDERILRNYYVFFQELNRLVPARKCGDCYRGLKWSNCFYDQGMASPLNSRYLEEAENANSFIHPAYRNFTHSDGQTRSLREVVKSYTVDWYMKENVYPDRRRAALYQIYSSLFDTLNTKLTAAPGSIVEAFAWNGTDNDIPYRQYIRLQGGWMSYYNRLQPTPWWSMTATYMGHLFGDGFHWWHDKVPESSDRNNQPTGYGIGAMDWEPDVAGTPNPARLGTNGATYPREPRINLQYTKLAEYRLKQYESFLTKPRSVVKYSLNAGSTWVSPNGNERRDLLQKAEDKNPICFKWDDGDLVMVFLSWPFATQPEWNVRLEIAPGVTRDVTMHRQWPMLRVFSKSNANYGL